MAIDHKQESALLRHARTLFIEGTFTGLTDSELLERFVERRGERSELAFTVLLERHAHMVLAACRRVLGDPHDVQDAFQATFLVLVRNARSIRNRESIAGWLQGVAYRVACTARSAAKRRQFHERTYAEQSEHGPASEIHLDADLKAVLDQELSRLPECHRVVIVLCDLEGLSYDQAAQALGWPMGTVKSRLSRGRDRLRSRLIRRGVAPSLAIVGQIWSPGSASAKVPAVLLQSTVNASMSAGVSQFTVMAIAPGVLKLAEKAMMSILLTKAKLSLAVIAVGSCLVATTVFFAAPRLTAAAQKTHDVQSQTIGEEKPATNPSPATGAPIQAIPKPWETAVRIRVLAQGAVRFGSGTVIQSSPEESLILTGARTFEVGNSLNGRPFPWRIVVDLFDGKLQPERPAQVQFVESVTAEAVDFDFTLNVGLIRIRPGRLLPVSPVVPKIWQPRAQMKMLTAGCSDGNDATFWITTIVNPNLTQLAGFGHYEAIECRVAPKQGRTGGGLFTTDGYLAGVCNYADPRRDTGFYVAPQSIYPLLDRKGLSSVYQYQRTESERADFGELLREDDRPDQPSDQPGALKKLEAKLSDVNDRLELEIKELRYRLSRLNAAAQTDSAPQAARGDKAPENLNLTKEPPVAPPPPGSERADRGSDPTHQVSTTQTPASPATRPEAPASSQHEAYLRVFGLIFAASSTGNRVVAHDTRTQKNLPIFLNATKEYPLEVSFVPSRFIVGLDLKGSRITRTAVYDRQAGTWVPLELSEPVSGELKSSSEGNGTLSYDAGRHHYSYSTQTGKWDHFDHGTITDTQE